MPNNGSNGGDTAGPPGSGAGPGESLELPSLATMPAATQEGSLLSHYASRLPENYEAIGILGEGGMGVVLLARDRRLKREVAIKVVLDEVAHRPGIKEAFLREAQAMARVKHRNVIEIYGFGEVDGVPHFVMEYLPGKNLQDWVASLGPRLALDVALGLLKQICEGVAAIHAAGAVHRDLKPENILVSQAIRAAIMDLGLTQLDGRRAFPKGTVAGTPEYMAPEVISLGLASGANESAVDVYALGVIAYELMTGQRPFEHHDIEKLLEMHVVEEPELPSVVCDGLSSVFDNALLAALQKDPAKRPSALQFLQSLQRARTHVAKSHAASSFRALVVDDDEDMRDWVEAVLQTEFPGARVELAVDGRAALKQLETMTPHLIVTDLKMPEVDGFELASRLRADTRFDHAPILVMTASGSSTDWARLKEVGADRFLIKPLDPEDFVSDLKASLKKRRSKFKSIVP